MISDKVLCDSCKNEVSPAKAVSMAGALFLNQLYVLYYYWIKGRHCPQCGHKFTKQELGSYKDPDRTWKYLSAVPIVLMILSFVWFMNTMSYYF
jgi:hypothetical protein